MSELTRRRLGRPKGSKNKPKVSVEAKPDMQTYREYCQGIIDSAEKKGILLSLFHFLHAFKLAVLDRKLDIVLALIIAIVPTILIAATLQSLTIIPSYPRTCPTGKQIQHFAWGGYDDYASREITTGITWWTTGGGTISTTGLLTCDSPGNIIVYASTAGVYDSTGIYEVTPLESIELRPRPGMTMQEGTEVQYHAWGYYGEGGWQEITSIVIWECTGGIVSSTGLLTITDAENLIVYVTTGGIYTSTGIIEHLPTEASFESAVRPCNLRVSWHPNTETDLAGYNLYFGYSPNEYSYLASTQNTTVDITGVSKGTRFFIGVSAYDTAGNESELSEIKYGVPDEEHARKGGSCSGIMR